MTKNNEGRRRMGKEAVLDRVVAAGLGGDIQAEMKEGEEPVMRGVQGRVFQAQGPERTKAKVTLEAPKRDQVVGNMEN